MITVIGATGFTGTLIARLLDKEGQSMRLTGRDQSKLDALASSLTRAPEKMILDVTDVNKLKAAISGSNVVINCAGPFTTFGLQVVEATVNAGVNYLDITGEQQFIAQVIERFSATAVKNNCTAIPSCAFEYALADAAAAMLFQDLEEMDGFEATYYIEGMYTSRGTKRSVVCALESPAFQLHDGTAELITGRDTSSYIASYRDFSVSDRKTVRRFPFPGGEVYLLPLHIPIRDISTYLTSEAPRTVLGLVSKVTPMIARTPFRGLFDIAIALSEPAPKRHEETSFKIFCVGSRYRGHSDIERHSFEISGKDPYFLTAKIVSQCAMVLNGPSEEVPRGVISASMLSGFQFIQSITETEGVSWKRTTR